MLDSFIHFSNLNLNKLTLYFQNDDEVKVMEKMTIEDLENIHTMPSRLNIFLPSSLFGFKRFKNPSNLKVDHLKALFFSEIEDRLISDISKLKFFYFNDLSLASWIDLDKYQSLLETLNLIDSDIFLYPEHFLLPSKKNTIYINDKFFIHDFNLKSKNNDKLHDINLLNYVAIHEMAHFACPDIGHGTIFKNIFRFFIHEAIKIGIYHKEDFNNNPTEYCGMILSSSII